MIPKKIFSVLFSLFLLNSLCAQQSDSSRYTYYYELAQERYSDNDLPAAMLAISKAIRMAPEAYELYLARGAFYHLQQDFGKAIADYDRSIDLQPSEPSLYYNRGLSWHAMNDPYKACDDFHKAYELSAARGTEPEFLQEIGHSMSILCSEQSPLYFVQRSTYHYNKGVYTEATRICDAGLTAFPHYAMLYIFRGYSLQKMQSYRSAITDYKKGIALYYSASAEDKLIMKQTILNAYHYLAECLYIQNDFSGAVKELSRGIKRGEWPAEMLYLERGNTHLVSGSYAKAMEDFDKGAELNPDYSELLAQRALCRMLNLGCIILTRKEILPAGCAHYWECFQFQYDRSKATDKAVIKASLKDCDKALAISPDNGNAYFIRGLIRELDGTDGCDDMRRARELHCAVDEIFLDKCP